MITSREPVDTDVEIKALTGKTSDGSEWDIILYRSEDREIWYQLPIGNDPACISLFGPFGRQREAIKEAKSHLKGML